MFTAMLVIRFKKAGQDGHKHTASSMNPGLLHIQSHLTGGFMWLRSYLASCMMSSNKVFLIGFECIFNL